jgi:glucose/mannose-6-phosphate isomerase
VSKIHVPWKCGKDIDNIVITAMGGSALGSDILRHSLFREIKVPVTIINDYNLPAYAGNRTLVIAISYSGGTEETISCLNQAISRQCKIFAISMGGKLKEILTAAGLSRYAYFFSPKFNPCNQPRIGLGYTLTSVLWALKNVCDIEFVNDSYINEAIDIIDLLNTEFGLSSKSSVPRKIAESLKGCIPILVSAEHLTGNMHVMSNQINENSKNFAAYFFVPELNHHLLEGIGFPKTNSKQIRFIFVESDLFTEKTKVRIKVTKEVLKKNKIRYLEYKCLGRKALLQNFEVLSFGSYLSYFFALTNNLNPSPIPFVDFFKDRLSKIS